MVGGTSWTDSIASGKLFLFSNFLPVHLDTDQREANDVYSYA
jgi:hypothetical protein